MSSYSTTRTKSNWKRPKPKIYDCNRRDFENLYKTSYDEYLSTKADRESRRIDMENRGGAEGLARRFEQRRANSLAFGDDDFTSRRHQPQQETESTFRHQLNSNGSHGNHDFVRSTTSASRGQARFNNDDINGADDGYEVRMERIRKLRQDMGLPAEASSGMSSSNTDSRFSSTVESSSSTRRRESPTEARNIRFMKTESSSSRAENMSRKSPPNSEYQSKSSYSSKYDTASGQNGYDDSAKTYSWREKVASAFEDDSSNGYSYKPNPRTVGSDDVNDFTSYESSVTSKLKDRKRVEKPSLDGIDLSFDDETLLKDMRKKIPSSSEILERIKNMDMD